MVESLSLLPWSHLCVVELHGVIGRQRHTQAFLQKFSQGVLGVLQEQAVVAQWGHGDRDLRQVVQILQDWTLRGEKGHVNTGPPVGEMCLYDVLLVVDYNSNMTLGTKH